MDKTLHRNTSPFVIGYAMLSVCLFASSTPVFGQTPRALPSEVESLNQDIENARQRLTDARAALQEAMEAWRAVHNNPAPCTIDPPPEIAAQRERLISTINDRNTALQVEAVSQNRKVREDFEAYVRMNAAGHDLNRIKSMSVLIVSRYDNVTRSFASLASAIAGEGIAHETEFHERCTAVQAGWGVIGHRIATFVEKYL